MQNALERIVLCFRVSVFLCDVFAQSDRSCSTGSIRSARRAGNHAASAATASINGPETSSADGSSGPTPNRSARSGARAAAPARFNHHANDGLQQRPAITIRTRLAGFAPSATRTPSSCGGSGTRRPSARRSDGGQQKREYRAGGQQHRDEPAVGWPARARSSRVVASNIGRLGSTRASARRSVSNIGWPAEGRTAIAATVRVTRAPSPSCRDG